MLLGFGMITDIRTDITSDAFPDKPNFSPLVTNDERQKVFGIIKYIADPKPDNKENIKITNNWAAQNIVKVSVKQLKAIKGSDTVYFHQKAAKQLVQLFSRPSKTPRISVCTASE
jgi:hypothetical protein